MLRYLKIFHPEQATKEYAEGWLQFWKSEFRKISLENLSNETLENYVLRNSSKLENL